MANNNGICLIRAMDDLWFHQIILFSQPVSLHYQETLKTPTYKLSSNSIPQGDEILSQTSTVTLPQDESNNEKLIKQKKRAKGLKIQASKSFSHSSSSSLSSSRSTKNRSKNLKYSGSITGLNKTTSCKRLEELEVEEVKGFIDLGFKFNKENLNPRVMKVLPGLQRLKKDQETEELEEQLGMIRRPYLSEAWIVKRSEFPLIELRVPIGVSADCDMKKHIRDWARNVVADCFYMDIKY